MVACVIQELWLVRHGETEWNSAGRFCGWSDPPLTEQGRAQAAALKNDLANHYFDAFVSSPSIRAVETARLAYGEPRIDDRLRELDFGRMEGTTWADCSVELQEKMRDFDSFQAPDGESVRQMSERVMRALGDLGPGRHLVVTHGGVVRFCLGGAGVTAYPQLASISRIRVAVTPEGPQVTIVERA